MISARSKSINLVAKVVVKAPAADAVELTWLKDADSGAVLAASRSDSLVTSVDKGKRVVPVVKYKSDGCWEAPAVALVPGTSSIE